MSPGGGSINRLRQTADCGYIAVGSFQDANQNTGAFVLNLDAAGTARWQLDLGPVGSPPWPPSPPSSKPPAAATWLGRFVNDPRTIRPWYDEGPQTLRPRLWHLTLCSGHSAIPCGYPSILMTTDPDALPDNAESMGSLSPMRALAYLALAAKFPEIDR